jgi:hypothetical protein
MSLVRIGQPLRPEFAAWRYGRQLDERRRRNWLPRAVHDTMDNDALFDTVKTVGWFVSPPVAIAASLVRKSYRRWYDNRLVPGIRHEGTILSIRRKGLSDMRFMTHESARWMLVIPHEHGTAQLHDAAALTMLGRLLTYVNDAGGTEQQVERAVGRIEHFGGGERMLDFMATRSRARASSITEALTYEQRLAIEMVAPEATERAALDGELASLEEAWREAEEVAAIADNLFMPEGIIERLRGRFAATSRARP